MTSTPYTPWRLIGALTLCAALPAAGQPAPTPSVSPVVVQGGLAPRLISSFPADGAKISGGVVVLKLKFDQAMSPQASLPAARPQKGDASPPCLVQPRLLADGKTFVILCSTQPQHTYEMNLTDIPGVFGVGDRPPQPAVLHFSTTDSIVDSIGDALEEAGLDAADDPVMSWTQTGASAAKAPLDSPPAAP